jgi:AraC-like DNA-binding protein
MMVRRMRKMAKSTKNDEQRRFRDALIHCVEAGDKKGAEECLSRLGSEGDYYLAHYDMEALKGFIITLNGMLVISSSQAGVDGETVDALSTFFNDEVLAAATVDDLRETMGALVPAYCDMVASSRQKEKQREGAYTAEVRKVMHDIEENLDDYDLKRESIAAALHINAVWLSVIFTRQVGLPLTDYIRAKRLDKAAALIREGKATITIGDIAASCGYLDQSYFARIFKRKFGISPSAYRNLPPSPKGEPPLR